MVESHESAEVPVREGSTWVWADGTRLPVVAGGSDAGVDAPDAGSAGDAGAAEPTSGATEATDAPAAPDTAPEAGTQAFEDLEKTYDALESSGELTPQSLAELRKLRGEHKAYRERFQPLEQSFAGWDPADRDSVLAWAQDLYSNDPARQSEAMQWMSEQMTALGTAPEGGPPEAGADDPDATPEFDPFDPTQVEALVERKATEMLAQREATLNENATVERIRSDIVAEAKTLGYSPDKDEVSYRMLLVTAKDMFNGDLTKAHEALQSANEKRYDEYIKAKLAEAGSPAPPEGGPPTGATLPRTMADADAAAKARISATFGGGST